MCLDSCHLYALRLRRPAPPRASKLPAGGGSRLGIGLERLGSLHLNDSQGALGSCRDRHANVGEGELGERGCATFLAAPAFEELPCVLETPGGDGGGPAAEEVALAIALRERGLQAAAKRTAKR